MERQRPLEKKGFMKRTFDKFRTSPRFATNPDDRPGYYVRGGDVPASGLDSNLTSEQIHTVLDKITPELVENAQRELAAPPSGGEWVVRHTGWSARGRDVHISPEESSSMRADFERIYPDAMRDLAATPVDEDIFDSARDVIREVAQLRTEVHDLRERISNEFHGMPPGVNIDDFDKE